MKWLKKHPLPEPTPSPSKPQFLSPGRLIFLLRQIGLFFRVLRDSVQRRYKLPWKLLAAVVVAFLYFINPFDLVPDWIPFLGYVDDAVALALCWKLIKLELLDYCAFFGLDPKRFGIA